MARVRIENSHIDPTEAEVILFVGIVVAYVLRLSADSIEESGVPLISSIVKAF